PFVQQRIAEEHQKLEDVGFDGVFEDQWGIRNTPYIYNDEIPKNSDPSNAYTVSVQNYLDSTDHNMYVEDGFDFMAKELVGFMGSTLLWNKAGYRPETEPYTEFYPMIGMLARDKVMLFQHDLAGDTMTNSIEMLRWNLAMGYNLSVDLVNGTDNPWIDVVGVFQKHVLKDYVDQRVES